MMQAMNASAKKACYAADDECVGEEGMRSQMWLRDVQLLQMLLAEKYCWSACIWEAGIWRRQTHKQVVNLVMPFRWK